VNYKLDFPMLNKDIIYFDNGATTFKPKCVIDSITDYYSNYTANAHRGDYKTSLKVDMAYEKVREKVKNFINAESIEEIVFTSGATHSMNMITKGFFSHILEEGDEVVITNNEHASVVLPWFVLEKDLKIKIRYIPLDKSLHVNIDNLKKVVNSKTKVICLSEVTNVIGDERPIKQITSFAKERNIFTVIDASQSAPHKKTDVLDLGVDFLVFSAHKMCGPTGVGVLYGKKEFLEEMEPLIYGGGMNESFDDSDHIYLKDLPTRLEAGTPNIAGVIGFGAAIDYLEKIKMDNIHLKEIKLKKYLVDKLSKIKHIDIINKEAENGICAFNVDGVFPQDVAIYLDKYNICVRAGNHCAKLSKKEVGVNNTVRISMYFYNTYEEIDKLVTLLSDKEKILKEMI